MISLWSIQVKIGSNSFSHALVKVEFLKQKVFKKHYVSGLFEPEQLAILYQKLLIFADFPEEGKFFCPKPSSNA